MSYNPKDHYFRKAKEQNYVARSVFKLDELQAKFKIIKPGQKILDLGASPGSWSQLASKLVGEKGSIVGIDLKPVTVKLANGCFFEADMLRMNFDDLILEDRFKPPYDIVMSDMAPNTTGIRFTDQARSKELCDMALSVADKYLKPGGHFVCKFFHSDDFTELRDDIRKRYKSCEALKPDSTRKISKEIFLVGLQKKAGPVTKPESPV